MTAPRGLPGRYVALLAVVGALGIVFTGLGADASAVQALGWAAAAGVGLSAMLRGPGLRVMGVLGILLALAAGASSVVAGGWAWVAVAFSLVLVVAALITTRDGPSWKATAGTREKAPARDLWKQFDTGEDPTTSDQAPDER